jgi:hypothetical protein
LRAQGRSRRGCCAEFDAVTDGRTCFLLRHDHGDHHLLEGGCTLDSTIQIAASETLEYSMGPFAKFTSARSVRRRTLSHRGPSQAPFAATRDRSGLRRADRSAAGKPSGFRAISGIGHRHPPHPLVSVASPGPWSNGRGSGRWAGCALPGNPVKITQRTFWDFR